MVTDFHIFVKTIFQTPAKRARLRKWQRYQLTSLIIHDFPKFVKLKCQESEKNPKSLEILTQRAVN